MPVMFSTRTTSATMGESEFLFKHSVLDLFSGYRARTTQTAHASGVGFRLLELYRCQINGDPLFG